MSTPRCQYHRRSASRRQQRHYWWYASFVAVFGLVLVFLVRSLRRRTLSHLYLHPALALNADAAKGVRCADSPADCEAAAPFIFDSTYALGKQWPNTYGPNGHSVVPVTFPPMPLYHAKQYAGPMKKPTWFAFDAEMSLGIYGGSEVSFLHTAIPSRPLNLLYFDGESATLTATGSLDSQTALLRHHIELNPSDEFTYNETARGQELCALAREFGIDGYMRMNAGFEVLVCDIDASKVQDVIVANVTVPGNYVRENNPTLPLDPNRQPPLGFGNTFVTEYAWDWVRSGAWHYGGYGNSGGTRRENRVEMDLCGMITFYDPLLHSVSGSHTGGIRGKELYENGWGLRRGHRLLGISSEDAKTVKKWIQLVLRRHRAPSLLGRLKNFWQPPLPCSGSNWQVITEVITDSHRSRAIEIAHVLRQYQREEVSKKMTMTRIHELSHAILAPYFQYPRDNMPLSEVKQQTISHCSSLFTSYIKPDSINAFEGLLKDSINIVLDKLCRWEWDLLEWSENQTTDIFRNPSRVDGWSTDEPSEEDMESYSDRTETLLNWIGWSTWTDCPTKCAIGELCYIPMWPVVYSNGTRQGSIYAGSKLTNEEERYFWSPKCLSREMWAKAGGRGRDPEHQFPDVPGNSGDGDH